MKRPCRMPMLAGLLLAWFAATPGLAQTLYLRDAPDLPLAPGLTELVDQALIYDKPGGRIVESYAAGRGNPDLVAVFYRNSLPQLGWRRTAPGTYVREGETLKITTQSDGEALTVRFFLSPD